MSKLARKLESKARGLRRRGVLEKYRRPEYEVKGTSELFEMFPDLKGRKLYLIRWTGKMLQILAEGTKTPVLYHPSYFKGFGPAIRKETS